LPFLSLSCLHHQKHGRKFRFLIDSWNNATDFWILIGRLHPPFLPLYCRTLFRKEERKGERTK
ncbi:unnamed protein product, partial [Musa acuminata var. zebrina]